MGARGTVGDEAVTKEVGVWRVGSNCQEESVEKRPDSGKSERAARPSLPTSLVTGSSRPGASEVKRSSDIVRHSSEVTKGGPGAGERRQPDLARKHSDSSRHSDKLGPAVHSTNLGNPEKFSFAKPERPAMDKVMAKNDRNVAKTESGEAQIGWKSDILSNRVTDITNGYKSLQEKENISGPCSCKEVIEEFPKKGFLLIKFFSCKI